jgi:hypothetical protein
MKKIFSLLLLFTAFLGQSQTYQNVLDLINLNLQSGTKITAEKHREVEKAILDFIQSSASQSGDVKPIRCDVTYLNDNFEVDGTGKNLRLGWKIVSDLSGRVIVGYGAGYSLAQTGGSADAVVVEHSHAMKYSNTASGTKYPELPYIGDAVGGNMQGTETTGVSGVGKNMQPYMVFLYIEKI